MLIIFIINIYQSQSPPMILPSNISFISPSGSHGHASTSVSPFTGISALNTIETVTSDYNSSSSSTSVEDVIGSMIQSTLTTLATSFLTDNSSNSTIVKRNEPIQQNSFPSPFDVITSVVMFHTSSAPPVQVTLFVSPTNATSLNSSLMAINITKTPFLSLSSVSGIASNLTSLTSASLVHGTLFVSLTNATSLNSSLTAINITKTPFLSSLSVSGSASNLTSSTGASPVQGTLFMSPMSPTPLNSSFTATHINKTLSSSSASVSGSTGNLSSSTGALYEATTMSTKLTSSLLKPNLYSFSSDPQKKETQTLFELPSTLKPSPFSSDVDVQGLSSVLSKRDTQTLQPSSSSLQPPLSSSIIYVNKSSSLLPKQETTKLQQSPSASQPSFSEAIILNLSSSVLFKEESEAVQPSSSLSQPEPSSLVVHVSSSVSSKQEIPVLSPSFSTRQALASLSGINVNASTTILYQGHPQTSLQSYNPSQSSSYSSSANVSSFSTLKQIKHTAQLSSSGPDTPFYSSSSDITISTTVNENRNPTVGVSTSDAASLKHTTSSSHLSSIQMNPTATANITATATSEAQAITAQAIPQPNTSAIVAALPQSTGTDTSVTSSLILSLSVVVSVTEEKTNSTTAGIITTKSSSLIGETETGIYNGSIQTTLMVASPTAIASVHIIATSKLITVAHPGSSYNASVSRATANVKLTSSVVPVPPPKPLDERDVEVSLQLVNEKFHSDLENKSSSKYQNLSAKVNETLTDLYSPILGFKEVTINGFSNGSVIVNHSVALSSSSSATTQQLEKALIAANGTNLGSFVFGQIITEEKCTSSFCKNSGTCKSNSQGAYCSCSSNYKGNRCDTLKDSVHGNYSNWSDFGECSQSCAGGRQFRRRTCTSPAPQYGGKNCSILGPETEFRNCNQDVRCPADWWIALAVCLGILVLIFILLLVLIIRRRRMRLQRAEEVGPHGKRYIPPGHSKVNGTRNTMVPLETMAIHNRTNSPRGSPEGHRNPEFINDNQDDEDDDIYKAQLLLFLKQHHLVAPGYDQDNASVTSEQSRRQSRRPSTNSEQNNQCEFDNGDQQGSYENEGINVDSIQIADSDTRRVSGASSTSRGGKR